MADTLHVHCPYCRSFAVLVGAMRIYPNRDDLAHRKFWFCEPCSAWVGCHEAGMGQGDGTQPLGVLTNAAGRTARRAAHAAFDSLWNSGGLSRNKAYAWLAKSLDIPLEECHIGHFGEARCARVVELVTEYFADKNTACAS